MIPRNHQNNKVQINNACPTCGTDLSDRGVTGFVQDNETFCCQGCAEGNGCTCAKPGIKRPSPRRGAIEQREPGASKGLPQRDDSRDHPPRATEQRRPSRKAGARKTPKRKRNLTKERDSTRQQARGRAEFTGSFNNGGATRVSRTGTKSPRG
jgi:hypothetical protein